MRRALAYTLLALVTLAAVVVPNATATPYEIQNGTGRCLDADTRTIGANGTKVQLWDCNDSLEQLWYIDTNASQTAGIARSALSGRCLDADTHTIGANGTIVQLWDCNMSLQQLWYGQGRSTILNALSMRALDADTRTLQFNGTNVQLWDPNGQPQQRWILIKQSGSISAGASDVTVPDSGVANDAITWSAPAPDTAVWASVNGGPPREIGVGATGSVVAGVSQGTTVFTLARGVDPSEALAQTTVTGIAPYPRQCGLHPSGAVSRVTASFVEGRRRPTTITTTAGRRVAITGVLRNAAGAALANTPVCVVARVRTPSAPQVAYAVVATNSVGRFRYTLPAGPSRTIWLVGDGPAGSVSTHLEANTRARVTLGPGVVRLHDRQGMVLRGRILGPIPRSGVLASAEVWRGNFWQPFETVRAGSRGRFVVDWYFSRTSVPTDYPMRVVISPDQPLYPYVPGSSRVVHVHVS